MKLAKVKSVLIGIIFMGLLMAAAGAVHAQAAAEAGVFEDFEVQPGVRFEVPVEVRGVENLFAIDIQVTFDPRVLQVEDANPVMEGIQPALGTFLDAGLTLFNRVDNEEGTVHFAMSQVQPSEPKSGDGIILVLYFVAEAEGTTDLEISFLEASDRFGEAVVLEPVNAEVRVTMDAATVARVSVPVQDQAGLIMVPTFTPMPTPTITPPVPTETPPAATAVSALLAEPGAQEAEPNEDPEALAAEAADPAQGSSAESAQRAIILDYWWAVLIVVVLAAGLGVYLWGGK